jgi:hypothetical protein
MADQETSGTPQHNIKKTEEKASIFQRLIRELFPTPEEKWSRKRRKRRRNPIKEYFDKLKKRRAYNKYQRREKKRKKRHAKTMLVEERKKKVRTIPLLQFFKKNFTRESKPYYYYAETDQPKSEIQRQRKRLLHFSINSTVIFLITYFVAYLTYQGMVMFVASRFGINSILYFFEVAFAQRNWDLWSSFNIILITFSGPLISVLLGIYYLFLFAKKEKFKGLSKLFYLWLAFHSLNFFLGAFPAGVITMQGFGYVIGWLYLPTFIRFGLSIIFLFSIGLVGYFNTHLFLESSNSMYWTQPSQRPWLVFLGGIIPWALSVIILFILKYPLVIPQHENIVQYDSILYMTMIFFIAPMLVNMKAKPVFDANVRKARGRRINWIYIGVLVIVLVAFRAGLDSGFSYFVFK